jgi:hypothetical protein
VCLAWIELLMRDVITTYLISKNSGYLTRNCRSSICNSSAVAIFKVSHGLLGRSAQVEENTRQP